jgi:hypothetical protein
MMKKISVNMFLFIFTIGLFAQKGNNEQSILPYDSTANFLGKNVQQYIGQELYLKGLDKSSQAYGYQGFILKYQKDDDLLNDEKNIYKPNGKNYSSRYEDMAGKYFQVIDVVRHPKAKNDVSEYGDEFYFKLQEKPDGDILYYKYNANSEFTFPFILTGFFLKERQRMIGKEYVISDDVLSMSRNLVSGKALAFTTGQIWKCIDFDVDGNNNDELSLLLQNGGGLRTAIPYSLLTSNEGIKKVYTASEALAMRKKYNENNYRRILQNKVRVGMTKEMTRLAWGEPTEIKQSGKNEIWSYPAGTLVFSGDKIISTK